MYVAEYRDYTNLVYRLKVLYNQDSYRVLQPKCELKLIVDCLYGDDELVISGHCLDSKQLLFVQLDFRTCAIEEAVSGYDKFIIPIQAIDYQIEKTLGFKPELNPAFGQATQ